MIDLTTTLGDLVTEDPRRARILEQLGLDYCCNGHRTIAEASELKGLDADRVAAAVDLPDPEPAPEWQSLGLTGLADHILDTHHAYLWEELGPLGSLVEKVLAAHGENHPELAALRADYAALANDLAQHLMKEERILFPAIKVTDGTASDGLGCGVDGPIKQMMVEHDLAGGLLEHMRTITDGYAVPDDGCASYRQLMYRLHMLELDLFTHIHKENNVLFPRALAASGLAVG